MNRPASPLRAIRLREGSKQTQSRAAIFFDRDGVLNQAAVRDGVPQAPSISDVSLLEGAARAVARTRTQGLLAIVVTNQPDIGRGTLDLDDATAINARLADELGLDDVYMCPHSGTEGCGCRKPAPGMFLQAAKDWNVDLTRSWCIGDRWLDIAAAAAAGVRSVLLEYAYSWNPTNGGIAPPTHLRPNLVGSDIEECVGSAIAAMAHPSPS